MAGLLLCACAPIVACGSGPTDVPDTSGASPDASGASPDTAGAPPDTSGPPPAASGVSLHALRNLSYSPIRTQLLSFQIDATGRPRSTGVLDVDETGTFAAAADPRGRRIYLATGRLVRSYSFDSHSGRLTETDTVPNSSEYPGADLGDLEADALTASSRYLYFTSHWRIGSSRSNYQLTTFSVADDGRLRRVAGEVLGTDLTSGPDVVVSPDGQIVYLLTGGDYGRGMVMVANGVDSQGRLVEKAALRFPGTWGTRGFFSVGSVLLASLGRSDDDALATVTFDRQRDALELHGLVPLSGQMRPFGVDGLLALMDDRRMVRYAVSSTGVVSDAGVVPDPEGYYLERGLPAFSLLRFHPSWRLGYVVGATAVRTFGVAASGQLTLLEETPLPEPGAAPSLVGVVLGPAS